MYQSLPSCLVSLIWWACKGLPRLSAYSMLYLAALSQRTLVTVVTFLPKLLLGDCGHHSNDCCWVTAVTLLLRCPSVGQALLLG